VQASFNLASGEAGEHRFAWPEQRAIGSRKFVVDLPANRPGPGWKRRLA
jgi:hypothetical protein